MKLYRYEKFEKKRLNTLENGQLWCSSPLNFNDKFDSRFNINPKPKKVFSSEFISLLSKTPFIDHPFDHEAVESMIVTLTETEDLKKIIRRVYDHLKSRDNILSTTAVNCFFSKGPFDYLMWAHYGDNHNGICVEYEVNCHDDNSLSEHNIYEVNYTSLIPKISIEEFLFCPNQTLTTILTRKSIEWSHEKKYRLVLLNSIKNKNSGTLVKLPEILKPSAIIAGSNVTNQKKQELRKRFSNKCCLYEIEVDYSECVLSRKRMV